MINYWKRVWEVTDVEDKLVLALCGLASLILFPIICVAVYGTWSAALSLIF